MVGIERPAIEVGGKQEVLIEHRRHIEIDGETVFTVLDAECRARLKFDNARIDQVF